MDVLKASGEIKAPRSIPTGRLGRAPDQTRGLTRDRALSLLERDGLTVDERFAVWSIAVGSADLTAADAWTVDRIEERIGRPS